MDSGSEIVEVDTDGSICSIQMRNFFCHDNLQIDFNKNINYIVGRNGSGKSAILTALVVGLGGRAAATNRGNNLNSFIKKGANSASVEIKIKNSSSQAYKYEVYGDYITIVRQINNSGGSSYKVKNAAGEVVSTNFETVKNIIRAHDIQVDNPISVLNQDDARSFHASDPRKKYMLFRKATNMEATEINYNKALETVKLATKICERKNEALQSVEKEYKELKAIHDRLQSRGAIEARKKALENEYYWSEILQYERQADLIQVQFDKQKAKIDKLAEKLNKMKEHYGNNNGALDALRSQLEEATEQRTALEQELREADEQLRPAQTTLRSLKAASAKHNDMLAREKRKIAEIQGEIDRIDSGDVATQRSTLEAAAAAAAAAADAVRARYETAKHHAAQAQLHATQAAAKLERAAAEPRRAREAHRSLKQQLRELETRGDDSLAVYGEKMVALCRAVKDAVAQGRFSAPPRGPVGAHLKVREKKWGSALEHILKNSLQSFCVNTDQDSRTLFEIMNRVYGKNSKPMVTCSKFLNKKHNVDRNTVRVSNYLSALDSLVIEDPVIANFLIDNIGVEEILLVPDHVEAQRFAERRENVPENCKKIVTLDCCEYMPAPDYRSYGGEAKPTRFLHVSSAEKKRQLVAEIKEKEAELRSLEAEEANLMQEAKEAKDAEHAAKKALQALLGERHACEKAERDAAAARGNQQQTHQAVLVDELNESNRRLATLAQQAEASAQKEKAQAEKIAELEHQLRDVRTRLGEVKATCRNLEEEIEQETLKLGRGVEERRTCENRLKEEANKLKEIEKALDERLTVIRAKIVDAEMLCERDENARDLETVKRELEKSKMKLKALHTDDRSAAEVAEELLRVETLWKQSTGKQQMVKNLAEELKKVTEDYRLFSFKIQKRIANVVLHTFNAILNINKYSGTMNIDFARGALELSCTGRESSRLAATTASLSGGERSYSTVAFVMALWACVEVPFFFLDEFDVFMDNVNRAKVMSLLHNHAVENPTQQFVFLTPQDASSAIAGPNVKIHKMADPRP